MSRSRNIAICSKLNIIPDFYIHTFCNIDPAPTFFCGSNFYVRSDAYDCPQLLTQTEIHTRNEVNEKMSNAENKLQIRKMSEVELQEINWLWYPYIARGKITMIQGDPGEGKTTLALRLAAACSTGQALPGMEIVEPFNVIYQTAEDGLGDTIKPRLMEAGADQDRVLNIAEDVNSLTLLDGRIEAAIVQTGAKLMILDPIQGYLGGKVDMNRANEIRTVLRNGAAVAERTGCAIVLVGHLNKATGANSAYRGLGSIDFRAAARSVLLVGRMKKEPNVRVIVHDKSSLAPEGKSIAFSLGDENGFCWLDGYNDITADELLCGFNAETKTAAAEDLIRDLLSDGEKVPCETIFSMAASRGISQRTVNQAKKNIPEIVTTKPSKKWFWQIPK